MAVFEVIISATDAGFTTTMKAAQTQMNLTALKAQALTSAMAGLRTFALVGAGSMAAMILPTILASRAVADFDATIRRVVSIGGEDFVGKAQSLTDSIMALSKQYGIAYEDIAEGVLQFTKAGFAYNDIVENLIVPTAQLAIVNQTDFANATEISTVAWTIFGEALAKEGKNAADMMQEMFTAANISLLEVEDLASALEYAGSAMSVASVPFEQFLALFSVLSQVGYKSGQNVRTLIQRLMVPNEDMLKLDNLLGEDGIIEMGTVNLDKLMTLLGKTDKMSPQALQTLVDAMGVRSTGAFMSAFKAGGLWEQMLARITNETGTLADASDNMANSITSAWQRLRTAFMESITSQKVINAMSEAINKLVDSISAGGLGETIADVLMSSINFLVTEGPGLINTLSEFGKTILSLMPTIASMAQSFAGFLKFVADLDPNILKLIATLYLFNRVIPFSVVNTKILGNYMADMNLKFRDTAKAAATTTYYFQGVGQGAKVLQKTAAVSAISVDKLGTEMIKANTKTLALNAGMQLLAMSGLMMVNVGMMAFVTAKDGFTKACAAMVMAGGMLTAILWQMAIAMGAFKNAQIPLIGWVAIAATTATILAGIAVAKKASDEQRAATANMANAIHSKGGLVKKSGMGFVHEGEIVGPDIEMAQVSRNYQVPLQYSHALGGSVAVSGMGYVHKDEAIIPVKEKDKKKKKLGNAKYVAEEGWTYLESHEIIVPRNRVEQLQDIIPNWNPKLQTEVLATPRMAITGPETANIKTITLPILSSSVTQKALREIDSKTDKESVSSSFVKLMRDKETERTKSAEKYQTETEKPNTRMLSTKNFFRNLESSLTSVENYYGYKTGGTVIEPGMAYVHKEEVVVPQKDYREYMREIASERIEKDSKDRLATSKVIDIETSTFGKISDSESHVEKSKDKSFVVSREDFKTDKSALSKILDKSSTSKESKDTSRLSKLERIQTAFVPSAYPGEMGNIVISKNEKITENIYRPTVLKVIPVTAKTVVDRASSSEKVRDSNIQKQFVGTSVRDYSRESLSDRTFINSAIENKYRELDKRESAKEAVFEKYTTNNIDKKYVHQEGGLVEKSGWGFIHEKEIILGGKDMANVTVLKTNTTTTETSGISKKDYKSFISVLSKNTQSLDNLRKSMILLDTSTVAHTTAVENNTNTTYGRMQESLPDFSQFTENPPVPGMEYYKPLPADYFDQRDRRLAELIATYSKETAKVGGFMNVTDTGRVQAYTPAEESLTGNKEDYIFYNDQVMKESEKPKHTSSGIQHFGENLYDSTTTWFHKNIVNNLQNVTRNILGDKNLGGKGPWINGPLLGHGPLGGTGPWINPIWKGNALQSIKEDFGVGNWKLPNLKWPWEKKKASAANVMASVSSVSTTNISDSLTSNIVDAGSKLSESILGGAINSLSKTNAFNQVISNTNTTKTSAATSNISKSIASSVLSSLTSVAITNAYNTNTTNTSDIAKAEIDKRSWRRGAAHQEGGLVKTSGWGFLHEQEFIVNTKELATVDRGGTVNKSATSNTTNNTENVTHNYDNRIVNIYSVKEEDLQRVMTRNGRRI